MTATPPLPRAIGQATARAVEAARAHDQAALDEAAGDLAALPAEQVGLVLGAVLRMLLEQAHPDGLAGEDVQAVLVRCARSNAGWLSGLDVGVLALLLTGALGVHQMADEVPTADPAAVARHAPLLVADLLTVAGGAVGDYLTAALDEIAVAETMELP
ncbi:hypothetical protein [Plantactinospora endophytica]|uniref:DUF1232 domain-containing protein n=1 Tax=Plantactinospora endophytica TaxID=673535 RepID=A0ABQ4DX59_9ACTN|nr:hypothetical protein [Plantactinospora endophytica]GIG87044.1 hypothetical protein Pen02_19800 [Plantactinospora endophytica]